MPPVHFLQLILLLLAATVVMALTARRLSLPPAVVFVLGGMGLALVPGAPSVSLDPDLVMTLFLPPLLQASAYFTVWREFRSNLRPILLLAVGAVGFTTVGLGFVLHALVPALPLAACFTFGAIVSPPDAVTAAAVLERLHIPRRLLVVLEGESLVNDAAGLVLYRLALGATMGGTFDAGGAAANFFYVSIAGIAFGLACGWVVVQIMRRLRDAKLEIAVSFLVAWGSYIGAEAIGASGVLATVAGGILMGIKQHAVLSPQTRIQAAAVWGFAIFVMEAFVFILIGLGLRGITERLDWMGLGRLAPLTAIIAAAIILLRFVWVFPATYLPRWLSPSLRRRDPSPPPRMIAVIGWAGMRGVVSLTIALALPTDFPGRDLMLFLTFGVILATVLIQGTTLGPLIVALRISRPPDPDTPSPEAAVRLVLSTSQLRYIEEQSTDPLTGAIARDLVREYQETATWLGRIKDMGAPARAERTARIALRLGALESARKSLLGFYREGLVANEILHVVERELDIDEVRLRRMVEGH